MASSQPSTVNPRHFMAVSKTAAKKTDPLGSGGPEGRAVPHTHSCSFFSPTTSSFHSVFLSMSHTLSLPRLDAPCLLFTLASSHHFYCFLLFFSSPLSCRHHMLPLPMREIPPCSPPDVLESGGEYQSQGTLPRDRGGRDPQAQSPSIHFLSFQEAGTRTFLGRNRKKKITIGSHKSRTIELV